VPPRRFSPPALAAVLLACAGCGSGGGEKRSDGRDAGPVLAQQGSGGDERTAPVPAQTATKNTTRLGGADPVADAAAVARAVFPGRTRETRPRAVVLVARDDWRAGISAAQLAAAPLSAPLLLGGADELPEVTRDALEELAPVGAPQARGAQVVRVGSVAPPGRLRSPVIEGTDPAALAQAIDRFHTEVGGTPGRDVVVAPLNRPDLAMPAAGWAAKSGDPVLWADRARLPPQTRAAIRSRPRPRIWVLGGPEGVGESVLARLRRLGPVTRIAGIDAVATAIAFARFRRSGFGWGVVDPGHGLVVASTRRPQDAAAAAPLSASGKYGPLLLVPDGRVLPNALQEYLLDIKPGYSEDPVRGVYNHAWLMGNESAVSVAVQARIDALLEITRVQAP